MKTAFFILSFIAFSFVSKAQSTDSLTVGYNGGAININARIRALAGSGGGSGSPAAGAANTFQITNGSGVLQSAVNTYWVGNKIGLGTSTPDFSFHINTTSTGDQDGIHINNTDNSKIASLIFGNTVSGQLGGLNLFGSSYSGTGGNRSGIFQSFSIAPQGYSFFNAYNNYEFYTISTNASDLAVSLAANGNMTFKKGGVFVNRSITGPVTSSITNPAPDGYTVFGVGSSGDVESGLGLRYFNATAVRPPQYPNYRANGGNIAFFDAGGGSVWAKKGILDFYTDSAQAARITILLNGNVGVGNINPTAKLHVTGSTLLNGGATITGALTTGTSVTYPTATDPADPSSGNAVQWFDGTNFKIKKNVGGTVTTAVIF